MYIKAQAKVWAFCYEHGIEFLKLYLLSSIFYLHKIYTSHMKLQSYSCGTWQSGIGDGQLLYDACTGEIVFCFH